MKRKIKTVILPSMIVPISLSVGILTSCARLNETNDEVEMNNKAKLSDEIKKYEQKFNQLKNNYPQTPENLDAEKVFDQLITRYYFELSNNEIEKTSDYVEYAIYLIKNKFQELQQQLENNSVSTSKPIGYIPTEIPKINNGKETEPKTPTNPVEPEPQPEPNPSGTDNASGTDTSEPQPDSNFGTSNSDQGSSSTSGNDAMQPQPDPDSNPGGGNTEQPQLPTIQPPRIPFIPMIPDQNEIIKKNNSYASYASMYNDSVVNPNDLYSEIYDRTFSIIPANAYANDPQSLLAFQGTGWLLDYHKVDDNNYKLFIATNMHIIGQYGNDSSDEKLNTLGYVNQNNTVASGFALGKAIKPTDFSPLPNNYNYVQPNARGAGVKYYANNQRLTSRDYRNGAITTMTQAFSTPRVIFAGVDFMDDETYNQYKDNINEVWESYKQRQREEIERLKRLRETEAASEIETFINTQYDKIPFYTDFGVLEMDVNLANADDTLRGWILDAIHAVDKYVARMSNRDAKLPNYTNSTNSMFPTLDMLSKGKELSQNNPAYEFGLSNAKNVYVAGYPSQNNGSKRTVFMQNNPIERDQDIVTPFYNRRGTKVPNSQYFGYSTNDVESRMDNGNLSIYSSLWNRPFIDNYGFNYNIKFSSLFYGASGSVVYNEFGEIIGIYSLIRSNASFGDLLDVSGFTPLLQTADINVIFDPSKKIYGYNLIDKTGFTHQTHSYRSNLSILYPNGFDGNGNRKTALFPNGF
ncbi:DUF31 family protein [Mycoplasma sp. Pen4]|uniref:MIP family Ig-specific serine endopeptidase n=1 Tax=Mycoplasma sp. Pen4 TaxID=640330 RepID=UPI001654AC3E|nr:DUF31 family protein [Mycoplasma sp. Pen4]QNM93335.1 DUF31 family protein [Mycoplasma sp. Pen4]